MRNAIVAVKNGEKTRPWQIDGITGATISTQAVASILHGSAGQWIPLVNRQLEILAAEGQHGRE